METQWSVTSKMGNMAWLDSRKGRKDRNDLKSSTGIDANPRMGS